jgi:hypothetical protein
LVGTRDASRAAIRDSVLAVPCGGCERDERVTEREDFVTARRSDVLDAPVAERDIGSSGRDLDLPDREFLDWVQDVDD